MTNADWICKTWYVTFARPLTVDERRRLDAENLAGVNTMADVRKLAQRVLGIQVVNIQEVKGSSEATKRAD